MTSQRDARRWVVHCKREPYDVYVGRPSVWGNPFSHEDGTLAQHEVATREQAVQEFEAWLLGQPDLVLRVKAELRGKVLGCWCYPRSCHGDVLARIANEEEDVMPEEVITATPPVTLFKLKKPSRKNTCQAVRCNNPAPNEVPGELWRVTSARLCDECLAIALAFSEANPGYEPPQTVFSPAERAELLHLQEVQDEVKLKRREGADVHGIVRDFKVVTRADLVRANEWLHDVVQERKQITAKEQEITGPMKLALSRVVALFKEVKQPWADAEIVLRRVIELAKFAEGENNERAMLEASVAVAAGDAEGAVEALSKVSHVSELPGVTGVDKWDFVVEDEAQLPREYLRPDLSLLKMHCNKTKAGEEPAPIAGVKFVRDVRLIVRGNGVSG